MSFADDLPILGVSIRAPSGAGAAESAAPEVRDDQYKYDHQVTGKIDDAVNGADGRKKEWLDGR